MPASFGDKKFIPCVLCDNGTNGAGLFKPALFCEGFSFVRCVRCGLVQKNPRLKEEEIIQRYSETYGNDYLSYELKNEATFLKLQQLALQDAGFYKCEKTLFCAKNTPSVLDIGCATGALLAYLRERNWRVTGVEISPSAEYARSERSLDVRSTPLEECKFPDNSFDVVLASHLIEHLNDPRVFLTEIKRILKNSGFLFITTPNISGFQARLYGSRWRSAIYDHLYLFSKRTLSKLLLATGYKVKSCRTWGGLAAGMAPKWLKKPADFLAKRFGFGDVMIMQVR
jgi:2-polyprenyl-3-methyl-5-hydroxy-6-metoxy-1,4-benzoquinol methylase